MTSRGDRSGVVEGRDPATRGPGGSGASPAKREATPSPRVAVEAADERGVVRQTRDERRRHPGPGRPARRSRAGRDPAGHRPGSRSAYGTDPHPQVWAPSGSSARAPEKRRDADFSPVRAHRRAPAVERQAMSPPAEDPHDTDGPQPPVAATGAGSSSADSLVRWLAPLRWPALCCRNLHRRIFQGIGIAQLPPGTTR